MNCGCDEFGYCYDHNPSLFHNERATEEAKQVTKDQKRAIRESSAVHHPKHYNAHPSGVECIAIVEHFNFNVGNAVKYLWRAGLKSASPIEDLKKAAQYIAFEIERLERGK